MVSRARGFGLLEAIVALVILSSAGFALFSWIGQNLADVRRIEDAQARSALQLTALALAANVNPFAEPVGERRVAKVAIRWTSTLIEPLRYSLPFAGGGSPRWQVGLYKLTVAGIDESTGVRVEFELERTGLNELNIAPRRLEIQP